MIIFFGQNYSFEAPSLSPVRPCLMVRSCHGYKDSKLDGLGPSKSDSDIPYSIKRLALSRKATEQETLQVA